MRGAAGRAVFLQRVLTHAAAGKFLGEVEQICGWQQARMNGGAHFVRDATLHQRGQA